MYQKPSSIELIPIARWQVRILANALISKGVKVSTSIVQDAVAQIHGHENWRSWTQVELPYMVLSSRAEHRLKMYTGLIPGKQALIEQAVRDGYAKRNRLNKRESPDAPETY